MNEEPLFFKIIPRHAIWGGKRIQEYFGYDVPDKTGQIWAFSAQNDGDTICQNGSFKGKTLSTLWTENPELFDSQKRKFPFIISLVAPVDNLSVQVHPTKKVAKKLGYSMGKNEAWVLLDTKQDTQLVYGSKVKIPELLNRINHRQFENTFNSIKTNTGDFIYIPAGTIHGLGKGNIAYEIQQSTDLTFRLYDYERRETDGSYRKLNIDEGVQSISDADSDYNTTHNYLRQKPVDLLKNDQIVIHEYISNSAFTITKVKVSGNVTLQKDGYWLTTVSAGKGKINGVPFKFSDNFIVPATMKQIQLSGNFTFMITSEQPVTGNNEKEE
ncbi:type I phosphomannose isomerase catalytic subunit [Lactiplantibacillus nangangensis]|uniref:Mannose-6-phosphate isomerase n=1 Tax=Lactiplantibacillus nangangensis TaxID=2559917 RepID=A0ABW1SGE2_9LACO|nr:type I phosphomannose isomerase catalytic subunit [Lactiplantibacillus nangangensis]